MKTERTRQRDISLGHGVYYNADDYVGLGRRIIIHVVDTTVLGCIVIGITTLWILIANELGSYFFLTVVSMVWSYVAVLAPSSIRTVGYRLMGCRIVNLRGERPSILRMTFRSMLWMFGPCNVAIDLIWCGIDDDRQTLRDRYAGTCLIRNQATPVGTGEIHLSYFFAFGYVQFFPRVTRATLSSGQC